MKKKPKSYSEAYEELQSIVSSIQNEEAGIDELEALTRRANELIAWCQARLREIEKEVNPEQAGN